MQAENISIQPSSAQKINKADPVNYDDKSSSDISDIFDDMNVIWGKLMHLAKLLRNIIQDYNQKKQLQNWDLQINSLKTRQKSIESQYRGDCTSACGSIFGGIATAGGSAFSDVGMTLGRATDQMIGGVTGYVSADGRRAAGIESSIADLQKQGSESYNHSLNETLGSARESVNKMLETGQQLMTLMGQFYHAFQRI